MRKSRKLISLLLAVVLTLSCFACLSSVSAFATEGDTLKGDVDKNGRVEITDVTLIQLYVAKDAGTVAKFENGTYDLAAADVDGNGTIDIMDATFTQLIIAHAEPTTAEPTTEAPTTTEPAEPTTEAPTTQEPTEAPTTEPATTTEPAGEDIYVLAGSSNFVENGWSPDPASYVMTKGEDGVYSADVPNVAAEEGALYQVKVVQFVGGDPANAVWHGMDGTDLNYDFMLNADGTVTVTYNPETAEIAVKGDTVIPPVYKIDSITAVGGGQGNFLNGIVWDPADESNKMTEVSEGVYEITYEECDTNTEYQFKFAANGGWDINWGLATDVVYNTPMEAAYNGGNALLNYESEEEYFDVTLRLDITGWDTIKKTGAKITVAIEGAPEPTTEEPTTEAPTTEAPTTEAPTTEAPTTEAPTTEPAAEDIYVLAGSSNFVETGWSPDPASYVMTKGEDGVYSVVVPEVAAEEGALYQVKVVQFVGGDPANAVWHGMDGTDLNYDFMLNADCDVTVTYNPETGEIAVTGPSVIPPVYKIDSIAAVGNGQGNFLNGITWDPAAAENKMTEVSEGVYEITFEECDTNTEYQFKFAANGGWDINWGLATDVVYNTPMEAAYNGGNALLNYESEEEYFDVTLRLDITGWDTIKKTGAKITVAIEGAPEPTTEEPTTVEPTTEAPTTEPVEPTTEAPTTEPVTEVTYGVAGDSADVFGSGWDPTNTANDMTKGEDGVYSITYNDVQAQDISFKVVTNHSWNPSYGWGTGNYVIKVTEACDVTIKFDPATETITVEGENVEIMNFSPDVIETMYVTGNDANVYGEAWNPSTNKMTEVSKGVYEILFEDVEDGQLQAKFCVNGSWTFNFGAGETKEVEVGNSLELKLNGDNIIIDIQEPGKLTMQFDTTNMDAYGNGGVARFFFAAEEPVPAGE
ncbi:dockerin type I domain-containing protein [Ruminococcus sp. JE7B6]|uniref:pullulanase X25 domain-containing protein n=1 Tax=Ruminococcus sp. JE7B6 TaxID=3233380 RepID=UPI00389A283B